MTSPTAAIPEIENPIGIEALGPVLDVFGFLLLSAPLLVVGGFVSLVVRMRRTTDDVVRHQIRWLAYAASVMALFFLLSFLPGLGNDEGWGGAIQTIGAMSFMLIPVATGLAILRYRLYDIDVVIRKTVVIAIVVAFIALVYVGVVAGVGALVGSTRISAPVGARGGHRGPRVPTGAGAGAQVRRPHRLRQARDAVRGGRDVRRPARRHLLLRRRASPDWPVCSARAWAPSAPRCA